MAFAPARKTRVRAARQRRDDAPEAQRGVPRGGRAIVLRDAERDAAELRVFAFCVFLATRSRARVRRGFGFVSRRVVFDVFVSVRSLHVK